MSRRNKVDDLIFSTMWAEGVRRGLEAGNACKPVPMRVVEHSNPLDDTSPVRHDYGIVEGGVCGFAWVKIRPANCAFANWLRDNGHGRTDSYSGGLIVWVGEFGQSMARKEAYARAMADYFRTMHVKCYAESRMD